MSITRYFRNAVAAQMSPRISFKDDKFIKVTPKHIEKGIVPQSEVIYLFEKNKIKEEENTVPILIALKTISADIRDSVKVFTSVDELTCVFFMPASLDRNGQIYLSKDKEPWFVREFLYPMIDEEICVGYEKDVDAYISASAAERNKIESWEDSFNYARLMFEYVSKCNWYSNKIGLNKNIPTEENCYIFCDTTVFASHNLLKLYDSIIEKETFSQSLYNRFISTLSTPKKTLHKNTTENMQKHSGQMGGEYPLSLSQRQSLNHLNNLTNGEILAVSGPPGTGKTTLLQSVVANLVTKHAIDTEEPPVIVASSTNNQAVTNIIDSFSSIKPIGIGNLEKRWVKITDSFATYFPSSSKIKEAKQNNYQINDELIIKLNSEEEKNISKKYMLSQCSDYFSENINSISKCESKIHNRLLNIENLKNSVISQLGSLLKKTEGEVVCDYLEKLKKTINEKESEISILEKQIEEKTLEIQKYQNRISEWEIAYKTLPFYIRILSFISSCKKKIVGWCNNLKNDYELLNFDATFDYNRIKIEYEKIIEEAENAKNILRINLAHKRQEKDICTSEYQSIDKELSAIAENVYNLKDITNFLVLDSIDLIKERLSKYTIADLNEKLDTSVRYIEFWLAIHYYECVWLQTKTLTDKQIGSNIDDVQINKLKEFAMITPCLVMTFFMLPKFFCVWHSNEKVSDYLYNFIDLLIVDEAGQTSPEIAAPSFALAKKAIVVGDEQQIPPVWGMTRALDETLAIYNQAITNDNEYGILIESGLNTCQSSVMNVALNSCPYDINEEHGLFLSEHRRCYDEIINYCNELVYKGKLIPLRNKESEGKKRILPLDKYPVIGYYDIPTEFSQTVGTSRVNHEEAKQIVLWISEHFTEIYNLYKAKEKDIELKDILAIITPFRAQANIIKNELKQSFSDYYKFIEVGTVHTFQGGERKIIIFSTTYSKTDNCHFINYNKNLMNVAVSRAKDAFWVFGSFDCLKNSPENSASGLLGKYISKNKVL